MIKAYLREDFVSYGISIFLIDEQEGYRRLLQQSGDQFSVHWVELQRAEAVFSEEPNPTFVLPFDAGRALLEVLVRHYQGAEDTRQLRRDYDAERKRVDDLSNALVDIARASAERGFRA